MDDGTGTGAEKTAASAEGSRSLTVLISVLSLAKAERACLMAYYGTQLLYFQHDGDMSLQYRYRLVGNLLDRSMRSKRPSRATVSARSIPRTSGGFSLQKQVHLSDYPISISVQLDRPLNRERYRVREDTYNLALQLIFTLHKRSGVFPRFTFISLRIGEWE